MRKIFVFGNEYFPGDEVAKGLLVAEDLPGGFELIDCDDPLEILDEQGEVLILDTVKGLREVSLLEDLSVLENSDSSTCHDLDLGFYLSLLRETGDVRNFVIIGLPFGERDFVKLREGVVKILGNL